MATDTNTINSATPVQALYDAIAAVFATHSNWTFIETVVIATNNYHVWKNHGTGVTDNNSLGQDFYVAFVVPAAGTGSLQFKTFEDYNATTDLMIRPCMEDGTNATNADGSGLATGGVALSTIAGVHVATFTLSAAPNTDDYYIAVSKNALKVALRRSDTPTVYSVYMGLFKTRVTIANEFPLCQGVNTTGTSNATNGTFGTSRHPGRLSLAANIQNFMHNLVPLTPTGGDTGNNDLFRGEAQASEVLLVAAGGSAGGNAPSFGRNRGVLYDVIQLPLASGVTPGMGDNLNDTTDGEHWWYMALGNITSWVDKDAV